jgi:adenine deaminase
MKILIREGSAAKNFEALHTLISEYPKMVMLCSDDKHPDDLAMGHINQLVKRAIDKGQDLYDVLTAACVNPVLHYGLPVGLLRVGDPADFIVVHSTKSWNVLQTYIDGEKVAEDGRSFLPERKHTIVNRFKTTAKSPTDFALKNNSQKIRVIEALDGQLHHQRIHLEPTGRHAARIIDGRRHSENRCCQPL